MIGQEGQPELLFLVCGILIAMILMGISALFIDVTGSKNGDQKDDQ